MEDSRQKAFQQLRPTCVELSSVALKFRGKQATVKAVSQALDKFHSVLEDEEVAQHLNPRLAEYAFFPLTHIFNESQRLSSRCLEVAVLSLQILADRGWRQSLSSKLGKQLLILLTLLAGGSPGKTQQEIPTDDLKVASFNCIGTVVMLLGATPTSRSIFGDVGTRNIVDQLVFLLLGAIADDLSDQVQLAASQTLFQVYEQVEERVLLASLLPRTVSTLTKVLRPSTQQRRTYKVLEANLNLLNSTLQRVLSDQAILESSDISKSQAIHSNSSKPIQEGEMGALDESWLKASSTQVKLALTNVVQLHNHDRLQVKRALGRLCLMVLEECAKALVECASLMLETVLYLSTNEELKDIASQLTYLLVSRPALVDDLQDSLRKWLSSLPRLMRAGGDDRPRLSILAQLSGGINLLSSIGHSSSIFQQSLPMTLIDSVTGAIQPQNQNMITIVSEPASSISHLVTTGFRGPKETFQPIELGSKSQQSSLAELELMITSLRALDQTSNITRTVIDTIPVSEGDQQLASMWLALKLLSKTASTDMVDFLEVTDKASELSISKPFLISDLYSYTLPLLVEDDAYEDVVARRGWQAQALALECLVLQAEQLGASYRPELMESLYPVLSMLGSQIDLLQRHGIVALNLLATACKYASVTEMLVDNADYLVNSIALKLNVSNLSPQAPQILLMMIRLCGARIVPFLDDLIGSIFVALDDFHGYPKLMEVLFEVLSAIVDEGAQQPNLAIIEGGKTPQHRKNVQRPSDLDDVIGDLATRKRRKRELADEDDGQVISAPQRPWSDKLDDPQQNKNPAEINSAIGGEEENESMPIASASEEKPEPLSKVHQLLLSIAQATPPHLASPSPKVQQTLLNMVDRITPLLANDEDTFLPLINSIWPSLTARLFGEIRADGDGEAAFNVCATAETIAKLCEGAGDFMAGRIEEIFPQLRTLWKSTCKKIEAGRARKDKKAPSSEPGKNLSAIADLQVVKAQSSDLQKNASQMYSSGLDRTTDSRILKSLMILFSSILNNVRIADDNGDAFMAILSPIMNESGNQSVRQALQNWNADAFWLADERMKMEQEIVDGDRDRNDRVWRSQSGLNSNRFSPLRTVVL